MRWKQGDMCLAGQESQDCYDFISDVGICGIYFSLALGTAKFKQLDESCSLVYFIKKKLKLNGNFEFMALNKFKITFGYRENLNKNSFTSYFFIESYY